MTNRSRSEATRRHLLLEVAKSYQISSNDLTPHGCRYDLVKGAWILEGSDTLLVESGDLQPPRTKKADMETGEDQKSD